MTNELLEWQIVKQGENWEERFDFVFKDFGGLSKKIYENGTSYESVPCEFMKSFIRQLLTSALLAQRTEMLSRLPEEKHSYSGCIAHRGLNGAGCEVCTESKGRNDNRAGWNTALTAVKEILSANQ